MRNPNDQATTELPGLPEFAPAPRLRHDLVMKAQGYEGPKVRKRCENCEHVAIDEHVSFGGRRGDFQTLRCAMGRFPVHRGGICAKHEPVVTYKPVAPDFEGALSAYINAQYLKKHR